MLAVDQLPIETKLNKTLPPCKLYGVRFPACALQLNQAELPAWQEHNTIRQTLLDWPELDALTTHRLHSCDQVLLDQRLNHLLAFSRISSSLHK